MSQKQTFIHTVVVRQVFVDHETRHVEFRCAFLGLTRCWRVLSGQNRLSLGRVLRVKPCVMSEPRFVVLAGGPRIDPSDINTLVVALNLVVLLVIALTTLLTPNIVKVPEVELRASLPLICHRFCLRIPLGLCLRD